MGFFTPLIGRLAFPGFFTTPIGRLAFQGRLALPDVLSARAGNRLGGIFLGHRLMANGTIFAPHVNTYFYSTDLTAFPSTNLTAFSLTNLTLQCRRARPADRTLRRILRAVAGL